MKRGEIWILRDDNYASKARPVVIIQTNHQQFNSVILCLLTTFRSTNIDTRVQILPAPQNGLQKISYVMTEKIITIDQMLLGTKIGNLTNLQMHQIAGQLSRVLGITKKDIENLS